MSGDNTSPRARGQLASGKISYEEVKKHNTPTDCWMIICGKVYDLSTFAADHPGGPGVVHEQAGLNATKAFLHAHPESIMTLTLGKDGLKECLVGEVDMATVPDRAVYNPSKREASVEPVLEEGTVPPIQAILNLHDLEAVAQRRMVATGKKQAWDYYSSGADDELTYNENVNVFQRVWLKPRVMVNVREVKTETTLLGTKADFPVYLSAVAMCGMGHEEGEKAWMVAANASKIPFMIPNLSSKPFDEIVATKAASQDAWFQVYVNPDKSIVKDQLVQLEKAGVKALCITADSAVPGKRERDLRNKIAQQLGQIGNATAAATGTKARKAGNYANRDPGLNWEDLEWFKQNTKIPLVIKGVQCAEDAVIAAQKGCKGIILSNHGGRNLDTSRSGLEVLPEVMAALRAEGLDQKMEVFVDGGIRRGTDIVKALALGAKGVGLGKPAVYAMYVMHTSVVSAPPHASTHRSAYGSEGIEKMLDILKEEFIKCMQLVGAASLSDLKPSMCDVTSLGNHADVAPLVPSPFAVIPALKNVRSPGIEEKKEPAEIKAEIARLQLQLPAGELDEFAPVKGFVRKLTCGFFAPQKIVSAKSASAVVHRTALLLYFYALACAAGSLMVFAGPSAFNSFQATLEASPFVYVAQLYAVFGLVLHALFAGYMSRSKLGYILKNPLSNGKLQLSGAVIAYLAYLHYEHYWNQPAINTLDDGSKDYFAYSAQIFSDPVNVVSYFLSIGAIFVHLKHGWPKTCMKMGLEPSVQTAVTEFGVQTTFVLAAALQASPLYFFVKAQGYIVA